MAKVYDGKIAIEGHDVADGFVGAEEVQFVHFVRRKPPTYITVPCLFSKCNVPYVVHVSFVPRGIRAII